MSNNENRKVVEDLYEAFGQGDVGRVLSLLSPSVAWQNHGPRTVEIYVPRVGRDAVGDWLGFLGSALEIGEFVTESFISDGDQVVVVGHEKGKARSTGKTYQTRFAHVWQLQDGLIARYDGFEDSHAIAEAFAKD